MSTYSECFNIGDVVYCNIENQKVNEAIAERDKLLRESGISQSTIKSSILVPPVIQPVVETKQSKEDDGNKNRFAPYVPDNHPKRVFEVETKKDKTMNEKKEKNERKPQDEEEKKQPPNPKTKKFKIPKLVNTNAGPMNKNKQGKQN